MAPLMRIYFTRKLFGTVLLCFGFFAWIFLFVDGMQRNSSLYIPVSLDMFRSNSRNILGAQQVYVVSLPSRLDRRKEMETLRLALGFQPWNYIDALSAKDPLVWKILDWVRNFRGKEPKIFGERDMPELDIGPTNLPFTWPNDLEDVSKSSQGLHLWNSDIFGQLTAVSQLLSSPYPPLTCSTQNYSIPVYSAKLPDFLILTPARVACWHSHLSVIHMIANGLSSGAFAVILEDDVDMEKDIDTQLRYLWTYLPNDWDVVFLGHCWSDEGSGRPLLMHQHPGNFFNRSFSVSGLFYSTKPKCTHAYALSRIGARRLLLHLRYPPFSYSRAIDQAFAWLVESGRLKSFSVVPSVVVQRKVTGSDIHDEVAKNGWKDILVNGVFQNLTSRTVPETLAY